MKKILSILTALLFAMQVGAQTIATKQGDSFTALLVLDSTYTLANLKDLSAYVNNTEVARKSLGTITATNTPRAFRMALTSATMRRFQGNNSLQIAVYDSLLGVKRTPTITLVVSASANSFNNGSTNAGVDATININVTSLGITSNVLLATVMKGDMGVDSTRYLQKSTAAGLYQPIGSYLPKSDTTLYQRKISGYQLSNNNYTTTEKSKLAGIAAGATANQTDAYLVSRLNHTGLQGITTVTGLQDSLANKVTKISGKGLSANDYTTVEKNKLAGIATGATANSTDAQLRDRSTHTGTQAQSTVTNLVANLAAKTDTATIATKLETLTSIAGLQVYNKSSYALFDGSTWEKKSGNVTSNGSGAAGTLIRVGSTSYWERKVLGNTYYPEWFGAVGDGSTDDAPEIQLTIDNAGEGYVVLSSKNYVVNSVIVLKRKVKIIGTGTGSIVTATHSGYVFSSQNTGGSTTGSGWDTDIMLRDFSVVGNGSSAAGIAWRYAFNWDISRVYVSNCVTGFLGRTDGFFWRFSFYKTEVKSCVNGYDFGLNSGMESTPLSMVHPSALDCSGVGLIVRDVFVASQITGGEFNSCAVGVKVLGNGTKAFSINGASFEDNTVGVQIGDTTDSANVNIIGCRFLVVSPYTGKKAVDVVRGGGVIELSAFNNYADTTIKISNNTGSIKVDNNTLYACPNYIAHNGTMYVSGQAGYSFSGGSVSVWGIGGTKVSGGLGLPSESAPSTPSTGVTIYGANNKLNTKGVNGYVGSIDFSSLGANRNFIFPDKSDTVSLLSRTQTFSGTNTFSGLTYLNRIVVNGDNNAVNIVRDNGLVNFYQADGTTRKAYIQSTGSSLILDASFGTGLFRVLTNSTERFRVWDSGNVTVQNGGTYTDIPSAAFSVNSATKGLLGPRMTSTQRDAISSPATGLEVFNTTAGTKDVYDGTAWRSLATTANLSSYLTSATAASTYQTALVSGTSLKTVNSTSLLGSGDVSVQPLNSNLTTIAGLTATTDNFLVGVSSAWASRTPAQVRTTLGLVVGTDVAAQSSLASYGLLSGTQTWTGLNSFGSSTTPTHSITMPAASTGWAHYNADGANYERVRGFWSGNVYHIDAEAAGTGTPRNFTLGGNMGINYAPSTTNALEVNIATQATSGIRLIHSSSTPFSAWRIKNRGVSNNTQFGTISNNDLEFLTNSAVVGAAFANGNWFFGPSPSGAGFMVDINGTARVQGAITVTGSVNVTAGSNKAVSTATLSGGTVTVSNTSVTASSIIYVTGQNCTSCGSYYISAKTAGTSFTITSTNASDASTVAFLIVN